MAAGSTSGLIDDPFCKLAWAGKVCIRAWGKAKGFTFYTVSGRKEKRERYQVLYNFRVDEQLQEITFTTEKLKEFMRSKGGLQTMTEPMRIFSALEYNRTAEIDHQCLRDNQETRQDEQLVWDFRNITSSTPGNNNTIGVKNRKNSGQTNACLASILPTKRSSGISVLFYSRCLTGWQKAIIVMGMLKLFYSHYKLHTIPMPTKLPHLMPPGIPHPPSIDCLQNITSVIFRMSCHTYQKEEVMEVLDSITNEVVLIQMVVRVGFDFFDEFGQMIFSAVGRRDLKVTDRSGHLIGVIRPNQITSSNQGGTYYICTTHPHSDSVSSSATLYMCHSSNPTHHLASFYLDNNYLYHCNGLGCLPNDVKALALCYATQQVVFNERVWTNFSYPNISTYPFRPT